MKYQVWVTQLEYGVVHVEAENEEAARKEAERLYNQRGVDWFDSELSDLDVKEEVR